MSEMESTGSIGNTSTTNTAAEQQQKQQQQRFDTSVKDTKSSTQSTQQQQQQQEEDVIPTAIVIKNIPFAIKKEQLLDVIAKMDLPLPYAFNYHFDNGVFRGLAFANFTNTEETTKVLTSLNGKEIGGRKLRVEYKKMLPQAERERIEREKREKRGQLEEQHKSLSNLSLHSLGQKPNNIFPNFINDNAAASNAAPAAANATGGTPLSNNQVLLSAQSTATSFYQQPGVGIPTRERPTQIPPPPTPQQQQSQQQQQRHPFMQSNPNNLGGAPTGGLERYYAPLPSSSTLPLPPQQLDFNDPDTLEIYSQLLLFKDRERFYYELAYPVGLSATHKRIINVLCSFLGLVEVYDPTFIIIRKKLLDRATLQSHLQQQGQVTMSHPLQPSSTGGSMNRSQSYTSLLQAHAAASVAAAANNGGADATGPNPGAGGSTTALPSGSASTTPKLQSHTQMPSLSNGAQVPNSSSAAAAAATGAAGPTQGVPSSPSQLLQPIALHQPESQQQSTPQQQQQSFLRQQAALTPSSRIPSGYSSNHTQLNSVNPLLRNSNGISPPSANVQPNTAQHRVPPSFYGQSSALQMGEGGPTPATSGAPLMGPQHTNGSLHSNFSTHSFSENPIGVTTGAAAEFNPASNLNGPEMVYTSLGSSGLGNGLEEGLSRSLSGLDLQSNSANNLGNYGANTARKPIW
ncbi:hypothetical protein ZYGR_0AG01160 [Zygosaccharomyces rouxii]|uniref:RRM domain-containing protein n=1 Tax=Zygosaccharomyces rouxii TaxID=4956 RepID=A0A1Q3A8Q3_ZYGRO|nr:hypothetical protein ZYGR_0AG01160 [Zygosaccharomyces rouxii]